jgi:predicted MPP superfamily phosphohydrolase
VRGVARRIRAVHYVGVILVAALFGIVIKGVLDTRIAREDLSFNVPFGPSALDGDPTRLSIAVVGDIHSPDGDAARRDLASLVDSVIDAAPDLVLLVGDYTAPPRDIADMDEHREAVAALMGRLSSVPHAAVLGNYETWSDPVAWSEALADAGLRVMENASAILETRAGPVCVRGFGDAYTGRFEYIDFPPVCTGLPMISLTHDPAGAFLPGVRGLVFAGHTHCGQVRLPLLGAPWTPSAAPPTARCGYYADADRVVFVTPGVGTSVVPFRFGAPARWSLIDLRFGSTADAR